MAAFESEHPPGASLREDITSATKVHFVLAEAFYGNLMRREESYRKQRKQQTVQGLALLGSVMKDRNA